MDWKLFWKVFRISFGVVFLLAAVIMLFFSLFAFDGIDFAYCMFSILTLIVGIIMVLFGYASLPKRQ